MSQFKRKFSVEYVCEFCTDIAMMLRSGIGSDEAVSMLAQDEEDAYATLVLEDMKKTLDSGKSLSAAMMQTNVFPKFATDMTQIGEKTGRLDSVLVSLSDYYNRNRTLSSAIKNAVVFPLILLVILFAVIIVLLTTILPVFNDVFAQLGSALSPAATTLMNVGIAINNYAFVILAVVLGIALLSYILYKVPATKAAIADFFGKLTKNGKMNRRMFAARFTSAMSMGLSSGFDLDDSLNMALTLAKSSREKEKIEKMKQQMLDGKAFDTALSESNILSAANCRMISVAFKTGNTDTVMADIAKQCDETASAGVTALVGTIEPLLVIIMSVIVGTILLSVMLPLVSIMTSIT